MKINISIIFLLLFCNSMRSQNICRDSSYRFQYFFGQSGATIYNLPDTTGRNYFYGNLPGNQGIAQFKTTWGDSIIWARKIIFSGGEGVRTATINKNKDFFIAGFYTFLDANNILTRRLLICKTDSNGLVKWLKQYYFTNTSQLNYPYGIPYNMFADENYLYIGSGANGSGNIGAFFKIDNTTGNIVWSKQVQKNAPYNFVILGPVYPKLNTVYFCTSVFPTTSPGPGSEKYFVLNKLDDQTGMIESYAYKMDYTVMKGLNAEHFKLNSDNSFSLIGLVAFDFNGTGDYTIINDYFSATINADFTPKSSNYFSNTVPLYVNTGIVDLNYKGGKAVLATQATDVKNRFFLTFDKDNNIARSRKFYSATSLFSVTGFNLNFDDKDNLHFIYNYSPNLFNNIQTEYARVSNLSPNSTLGCFGKDTSILTTHPFTLIKQPFTWDNVQDNVIAAADVPYTQDTATVTKQIICKIVSYCDSLKITGPPTACVNQPVRYTVTRNNICQKFNEWAIDTAFANIVNIEGDSAITLSFKQPFTGYLYAALSDCVVKDSIFIKAVTPVKKILLPPQDSVLCPGKTLTLNAGNGFTNYTWPGNSPGQSITVSSAGKYRVTALDSCNNPVTDSITVTLTDTSLALPANQSICLYDTAFITLPQDVTNITWQPATSSLLRNNSIVAYPKQTTLYTITAQRLANCPINRISQVTIKPCPRTFYVPNSFTPNTDGKNDYFKPAISQPLVAYRFTIYNRYGQIVFETSSQTTGWDGTYRNSPQPMGGYIYYCTYRFNGGIQNTEKGYFMLIR